MTINSWRNDESLIACLGAPFRYINLEVDEKWFDNYMSNRSTVVRCSIDYLNQSAVLHIMIGNKENRGKGIGTFAVTEMLKHAFYNLNLHRVELTVFSSNVAAQRLYEKCGFVKEGVKRQAVFKNGKFVDMYYYAILREDF